MQTKGLETKDDFTLLRRAIKQKWPIPESLRQKAVKLLERSMDRPDVDPIQAIRTLVEMDKVNVKHESTHTPKEHLHYHTMTDAQIQSRLNELKNEYVIVSIQEACREQTIGLLTEDD